MDSVFKYLQIGAKLDTQKLVTIELIESATKCTTHYLISLEIGSD